MTRTIACAGIVCAALAFAVAMCTGVASAAQCGCPPPTQPPTVPQPLPALQPGGGYVFLMWVGK